MTLPTNLDALLEYIRKTPLREHEDIPKISETLNRVLKLKDEKDEQGKLTQAAKDARQTLNNPRLKTSHRNTRRRAIQIAYENQSQVLREAITTALYETLKAEQIKIELDRFAPEEVSSDCLNPSRETHEDEQVARFLGPLIKALRKHRIAPSNVQRAPAYITDLVARIYASAIADPELEDENGLLVLMAKAGIFELYRGEMSEAELAVFDFVTSAPQGDEVTQIQQSFHQRFPDVEPVSTAFIEGCMRLRDMTSELSDGAFEASQDATQTYLQNEARVVASILGWDERRMLGAQAIVRFIREQRDRENGHTGRAAFLVFQVQLMLDKLRPEASEAQQWLPRFTEWMIEFASQMRGVVGSETVFFALMYAAFENSLAKVKLEELTNSSKFMEQLQEAERSRRAAAASGAKYKLTASGHAVTEDDEDYHYIPGPPIIGEAALFGKIIPIGDEFPRLETGRPLRFVGEEYPDEKQAIKPREEDDDDEENMLGTAFSEKLTFVASTGHTPVDVSSSTPEPVDGANCNGHAEPWAGVNDLGKNEALGGAVPAPKPSQALPLFDEDEEDWDE
ncbi:hypothetical protein K3181_12050 [Qipengyuania sp. YG27]|uniref:DUF1631 family protein n=1 Tax=Qipengyuania mesophila TaxID=2867246 RepID=A0ABS7JX05_9SPHN|nr:hypothetical protein [Qipengyuania mesophila]MBX7502175.1 hypothetical protein [Qipengyuania mesophila]